MKIKDRVIKANRAQELINKIAHCKHQMNDPRSAIKAMKKLIRKYNSELEPLMEAYEAEKEIQRIRGLKLSGFNRDPKTGLDI